jgi:hypothetical protein
MLSSTHLGCPIKGKKVFHTADDAVTVDKSLAEKGVQKGAVAKRMTRRWVVWLRVTTQ